MLKTLRLLLTLFLVIFFQKKLEAQLQLIPTITNVDASFRGLSVVDDNVAWVSGSKGTVGITKDGGRSWRFTTVEGHEVSDFRSIFAFDESRVVIANAGSPAHIQLTTDGGLNWQVVYSNTHEAAFIDGVDFWDNQSGMMYGDPIDGKMLILQTSDGGSTWKELQGAPLQEGEASFAASGTGIRCYNKSEVMISTGGLRSRIWKGQVKENKWSSIDVPFIQGQPASGIYSFANNSDLIIAVGGDYTQPAAAEKQSLYSADAGENWAEAITPARGYRECVELIGETTALAVGPTGMDISTDKGIHWQPLNDATGFHVVRKARNGSLILSAGARGQIAVIKQ